MKGQVKVSGGQNSNLNDTSSSSSSNFESDYHKSYYEDHPPSQELVGKNDDTYKLFIVPVS